MSKYGIKRGHRNVSKYFGGSSKENPAFGYEKIHRSPGKLTTTLPTLSAILFLLTACGNDDGVVISVSPQPVASPTNLPISGLDMAGMDCFKVKVNTGNTLLTSTPTVVQNETSLQLQPALNVVPAENVEGPVTGEITLGTLKTVVDWLKVQRCDKQVTFNFVLNVDTHAPVCEEGSQNDGGSVLLQCDNDGDVIDVQTGQVIAHVGSTAVVPVDQLARTRDVVVQDAAGNISQPTTLSLATDVQQIPGQIRVNPQTKIVEIEIMSNGWAIIDVNGVQTLVSPGNSWLGISGANGNSVPVNNLHGRDTQLLIQVPPQGQPIVQITDLQVKGGNYVATASCVVPTSISESNCIISFGGETNIIEGNGTVAEIKTDAIIGGSHEMPVTACDTVGDCATPLVVQVPAYQPFDGAGVFTTRKEGKNDFQVVVQHPDPTSSLEPQSSPVVNQDNAAMQVTWVKKFVNSLMPSKVTKTVDCKPNAAKSNTNVTVFDCRAAKHGTVTAGAKIKEKGGEEVFIASQPAVIENLPVLSRGALELLPPVTFISLALLGIILVKRAKNNMESGANATRVRSFFNNINVVGTGSELHDNMDYYLKALSAKGYATDFYRRLIIQKVSFREIESEIRDFTHMYGYSPDALSLFINKYIKITGKDTIENLRGFIEERDDLLGMLLGRLNEFLGMVAQSGEEGMVNLSSQVVRDEKMFDFLKSLYELRDDRDHWFWKEANREVSDKEKGMKREFPNIRRKTIELILLANLREKGELEDRRWGKWISFFNKKRRGADLHRKEVLEIVKKVNLV